MDPYHYKNERFTCRASIADYDLYKDWQDQSCPQCTKSLSDKTNVFKIKCIKHNEVTPIPWFRVDCVVTNDSDVGTFLMAGKIAKHFFISSVHNYLYDKEFVDCIPPPVIDKLNKIKIFQLRFGALRSVVNRCDIVITNVFNDNMTDKSPHLPAQADLHVVAVVLTNPAALSSSGTTSLLDPITSTSIAPPRADTTHSLQTHPLPMQSVFNACLPSQIKR